MACGIYAILNKITNQIYVGQSINIKKRFRNHKWFLNHNEHSNDYLQHAWNKYGEVSFEFIILEYCSKEELNDKESFWIKHYDSVNSNNGYNLTSGGILIILYLRVLEINYRRDLVEKNIICMDVNILWNLVKKCQGILTLLKGIYLHGG